MKDGVRQQLGPRAALFGAHGGQARQVQHAHAHDDRADNRRDAEDLLPLIPSRIGTGADSGLRELLAALVLSSFVFFGRSLSLFNLLCSVFRLMPRISAARVLLSRVCSSVIMISRRSASSTVVPGASATCGCCGAGGSSARSGGRCFGSMNGRRRESSRAR